MEREQELAWAEYLAWTRGAAEGQYEITEERAWNRLERTLLAVRLRPDGLIPHASPPLSIDPPPRA